MKDMYYTYILENRIDKSWYIGYSANLKRRIHDHLSGVGCRTTSRREGLQLMYYEAYLDKHDAMGRERFLKSGAGRTYIKKQLRYYLQL